MPKINNIHKLDRLRDRIAQLERGEEVAVEDINVLLTVEQRQNLKDAWANQKQQRETKVIKKSEWKSIREVRLEYLKQVLAKRDLNVVEEFDGLVEQREIKASKVFMDAYCEAFDKGENAMSKANIALQRNGFQPMHTVRAGMTRRDRELRVMEDELRKRFEAVMTDEEREQLEMAREYDKEAEKRAKK